MRKLALQTLLHDRARFIASLAGVIFASVLVFTQLGLYCGFLYSLTMIVDRAAADVWVMAAGTETVDNAERLSPGTREVVAEGPCVSRVRALVFDRALARKRRGALVRVRVVGADPREGAPTLPWATVAGLPSDLRTPMRVTVDTTDRAKLELPDDPVASQLEVAGRLTTIAGVSEGIHSATTLPLLFASTDTARELVGMPRGAANFWLLDLKERSCLPQVVEALRAAPGLTAMTTGELRAKTEQYWLKASGIGAAMTLAAVLGLTVGAFVVGQNLYGAVRDHERELATLRALGAGRGRLVCFVAWQVAVVSGVGIAVGYLMAAGLRRLVQSSTLVIRLPTGAALLGIAALLGMAILSSVFAARRVFRVDPATVFL